MTMTIACPEPEPRPAGSLRRRMPRETSRAVLRDVMRRAPREAPRASAPTAPAAPATPATPIPDLPAPRVDPEAGLATAEYALATVAAAGFAGLLIALLKSGEVQGLLTGIIRTALSVG